MWFYYHVTIAIVPLIFFGCSRPSSTPELVWGHRGVMPGDLSRPRAIALDRENRLFVVDFTPRIQVYDLDGNYQGITWRTPDFRNGRPSGLGIDRDGNLIVCDSHYHCIRIYSADGKEIRKIGGDPGKKPGEFGYISDAVQDEAGFFYVSEFGQNDRITKLDNDGKYITSWGELGTEPGQFNRVRALALGPEGNIYAADSCNHRIQVFTKSGKYVRSFGNPGSNPGEFSYPYDLSFAPSGELYVVEYGNHRVQKLNTQGQSLATWGVPGKKPGQLANPWALSVDQEGRVHIVDTDNHRIQRITF